MTAAVRIMKKAPVICSIAFILLIEGRRLKVYGMQIKCH